MYNCAKETNASIIRGSYETFYGPFRTNDISNFSNLKGNHLIIPSDDKDYIVTEFPGIGNKLIKRDLIDKIIFPSNQKWEDLAIIPFLLAKSKSIYHIEKPVYQYRINMNTTIKDFVLKTPKILDIFKSLDYLENLFNENDLKNKFQKQIKQIYILHTLFRVECILNWVDINTFKKKELICSLINLLSIKYPDWNNNEIINIYRKINPLFNFDMYLIESIIKNNSNSLSKSELEEKVKILTK